MKFKVQEEYKKEVCNDHETLAGNMWKDIGIYCFLHFQNKILKKQVTKESEKSSELEEMV